MKTPHKATELGVVALLQEQIPNIAGTIACEHESKPLSPGFKSNLLKE